MLGVVDPGKVKVPRRVLGKRDSISTTSTIWHRSLQTDIISSFNGVCISNILSSPLVVGARDLLLFSFTYALHVSYPALIDHT